MRKKIQLLRNENVYTPSEGKTALDNAKTDLSNVVLNDGEIVIGRYQENNENVKTVLGIKHNIEADGQENPVEGMTFFTNSDNFVSKPVVLYQTDGTTGLLGVNPSQLGNDWQLENYDFSPYKYLRCYFKMGNFSTNGVELTPSMVVELPLDIESKSKSAGDSTQEEPKTACDMYIAGGMSPNPSDPSNAFSVLVAVDSTKTKFQVINQMMYDEYQYDNTYGNSETPANNNGRFLYKIEGCYDTLNNASTSELVEHDPVFTASPAYGITSTDIDNWNSMVSGGGITGITMNGSSKGTSGVVDLGTVVTEETDPTVPSWAKASTKPTYTASEVGAVPTTRTVNGRELSSDISLTSTDIGAVPRSRTVNGLSLSGNINLTAEDVGALPSSTVIPTKVSELTNDSGFIDKAMYYGTSDTAAATMPKVCTVETFPTYTNNGVTHAKEGTIIAVKFTNSDTNTTAAPELNVNGIGAKAIMYNNAIVTSTAKNTTVAGYAKQIAYYRYDPELDEGNGAWEFLAKSVDSNSTYSNASLGQGYGTQSNSSAATAITSSISSYALSAGGIVTIKFKYDVPANATLNISSKGAKAIYNQGAAITAGVIKAGDTATFIYSTYYHLIAVDSWQDKADVADIPTKVSDLTNDSGFTTNTGTITGITMNGSSKGTSGVVDLGTVLTSHQDISGKADKSAAIGSLSLALDSTNYKITLSGTKVDGTSFTVSNVIDLPLESVVVSGSYNNTTKKVVLTLQNGSTIDFSVADLVAGLQSEITSTNKLSADLISDGTTNKVVTSTEKNSWNNAVSNSHTHSNKTVLDGITSTDITNWNGKTDNIGTVTGVKMNNTTNNPTDGVVDLGTVITSETQLSKGTTTGSGNAVTDITVNGHQITLAKGSTFLTSHQSIKTINGNSLVGTGNVEIIAVPSFTSADNGKILGVVNGQLAWVTPTTIYTGSGTPSSSQGNDGDIYLQTN